ncbi:MAG: glycosyltransferase family 4 protein [Muribaculaceae bacterium]|nr:glycosyltransferase family 4 protein [Muribaculaceae bacterium]
MSLEKKPELLIIDTHPLGTLTDTFMWCENLKGEYDITLLCFKNVHGAVTSMSGIKIKEVKYDNSLFIRGLRFILSSIITASTFRGKIFVVYFKGCNLLKTCLPWKRMNLDIRTLSVSQNKETRDKLDAQIVATCRKYDSVSIISRGLIEKTGLKQAHLLPLGSNIISDAPKSYIGTVRLLYVGTLRGRNIDQTIAGFKQFVASHPDVDIHYDIIGTGSEQENNAITEMAADPLIKDKITYHGFVRHTELSPFFQKANVGVAYVPVTEYYEFQPPTKVYEYALSGLYTIATDTFSNKELITEQNGVVVKDTPEGFCHGIEKFVAMRHSLSEKAIRKSLADFTWNNVVEQFLRPILSSL